MSMQYTGSALIAGTNFFITGAEIGITRAPIAPDLIWGSGWKVNYATGQKRAEYSISFPLFSSYMSVLKQIAFAPYSGTGARDTFFSATLDNGGVNVVYANSKVQSLSFSADAMGNTPVTCTLRCVSEDGVPSAHASSTETPTQTLGQTPIPSYAVVMAVTGGDLGVGGIPSNSITRFDLTIENNPFRLWTLDVLPTAADIQEGLQGVTGSFQYYSGASGAPTGAITNGSIAFSGAFVLTIPSFLITSDTNPISSPNEKPMRVLSFEAFGDATHPPIY